MSSGELMVAVAALAPAVRETAVALIRELSEGDGDAARKSLEAALRLQFEARQELLERTGARAVRGDGG